LALAACAAGGSTSPTPSRSPSPAASAPVGPTQTVTGYVHAGPTCPVQQVNASACERLVVSAKIVVTRPDGTAVTVILSDAAGRFSLDLPAGTYLFTPQPVEGLMGVAAPI